MQKRLTGRKFSKEDSLNEQINGNLFRHKALKYTFYKFTFFTDSARLTIDFFIALAVWNTKTAKTKKITANIEKTTVKIDPTKRILNVKSYKFDDIEGSI
jgi:hypothetical protein